MLQSFLSLIKKISVILCDGHEDISVLLSLLYYFLDYKLNFEFLYFVENLIDNIYDY